MKIDSSPISQIILAFLVVGILSIFTYCFIELFPTEKVITEPVEALYYEGNFNQNTGDFYIKVAGK